MNASALAGLRILDVSTLLAGPLTATLLAEQGAEVIKIERPGVGDPVRRFRPHANGISLHAKLTNRCKLGVTLDLHFAEGRALLHRLVAVSDVVISNFRPAAAVRFGIEYAQIREHRPDVVLLHLTGFGRTGPYRDRAAFARVAEAFAGLTHTTGYPDRPPVLSGYPVGDGIAGYFGAWALMLALYHRERSGEGQLIDLALYEPVLRMMEDLIVPYGESGTVKERSGNDNPLLAPNGLFESRDGHHVVIPASTEELWQRLVPLLDDPALGALNSNEQRLENRDRVDAAVRRLAKSHNLVELIDLLASVDVAATAVMSVADVANNEHISDRENLVRVWDEETRRNLLMQAPVPRYSTFSAVPLRPGPALGEHNKQVFGGLLGLDPSELAELSERRVI